MIFSLKNKEFERIVWYSSDDNLVTKVGFMYTC